MTCKALIRRRWKCKRPIQRLHGRCRYREDTNGFFTRRKLMENNDQNVKLHIFGDVTDAGTWLTEKSLHTNIFVFTNTLAVSWLLLPPRWTIKRITLPIKSLSEILFRCCNHTKFLLSFGHWEHVKFIVSLFKIINFWPLKLYVKFALLWYYCDHNLCFAFLVCNFLCKIFHSYYLQSLIAFAIPFYCRAQFLPQ